MVIDAMTSPKEQILLGRYRIERVLGQGGMGTVIAARHLELGELHAIKMLHLHAAQSDSAAERFLREARALAKLKGDHLARVYDVGRDADERLYMVMEYLEGMDLKTYLASKRKLPVEEAVHYVLQACEGIEEAHELGIVHRDLKPANLFLTKKRKASAPMLKVLDFGISKELVAGADAGLTKSSAVLGSPLYMSPEQMESSRKVDKRTDIWSLGVVLYELIAGTPPFQGHSMMQVMQRVMMVEPAPIQTLVPEISSALAQVITRCLQKRPDARFESIEALAEALRAAMKHAPESVQAANATKPAPVLDAEVETAKDVDNGALDSTVPQRASTQEPQVDVLVSPAPRGTAPLSMTLPSAMPDGHAKPAEVQRKRARQLAWSGLALLGLGIALYMFRSHLPNTMTTVQESARSAPPIATESRPPPLDPLVSPSSTVGAAPVPSPSTMSASTSLAKALSAIASSIAPSGTSKASSPAPSPSPTPSAPPSTTANHSVRWGQGPL